MLQIRTTLGTSIAAYRFNKHPPLGVNATAAVVTAREVYRIALFQQAPTLGGECYGEYVQVGDRELATGFQQAPTLGGECYAFR